MMSIAKILTAKPKVIKLNKNQAGDIPVGSILVIGLIAIPLVIALIIFRESIYIFLIDNWVEFVTSE